jgi:hypothetical protein
LEKSKPGMAAVEAQGHEGKFKDEIGIFILFSELNGFLRNQRR